MYCKDCKHWDADPYNVHSPEDVHTGECPVLAETVEFEASVWSGGYDIGPMSIPALFGCIQFKGRNQDEEVSST